jgi:hypothetical protein
MPRRTKEESDMKIQACTLALGLLLLAGAAQAQAPVADYFSTSSQWDGAALTPGMVIEAYDGDGVRCGEATANADGSFLIHVYGNDPMTPADEGANEGEMLTWRIHNQMPDAVEWVSNLIGLFQDLRFENGAAKEMYIEGAPLAVEDAPWSDFKRLYQ